MDVLTSAADAVFSYDSEEGCGGRPLHLTPSKRGREVLSEVTHTINISPDRYHRSSLQALFTAPTTEYCSTKRQGSSVITIMTPSGSSKPGLPSSPTIEASSLSTKKVRGSPLTPNSNLKLLTRIASMEESVPSKKVLFCSKDVNNKRKETPSLMPHTTQTRPHLKHKLQRFNSDSLSTSQASRKTGVTGGRRSLKKHCSTDGQTQVPEEGVGVLLPMDEVTIRTTDGSRKDKSLGLLSEKFLEHFPMEVSFLETPRRMVIDEVATALGTGRRRVYDIINVLESLSMAARVQKNMYQWMGNLYLRETLGRLKAIAIKLNLRQQIQAFNVSNVKGNFKWVKTNWNADGEKVDSRREKSLGILCQKLLMLLLVSPEPYLLSLDDAMKMLMGDMGEDSDRLRTRGRRLYDIANVLTSLGLVQRIPLAKGFRYIGPQVEPIPNDKDTGMRLRHSLLPSCVWAPDTAWKENMSVPGDHDLTPSAAPPPTQKRGRPRKLSSDFTASAIPAAKRTKLHRTRSEDITAGKQSRRFTRHPSLHEICQVAEVEREKLLQKEQQQRLLQQQFQQQQQQEVHAVVELLPPVPRKEEAVPLPTSSASAPILATILHQRHCPKRAKIPVALTFRKNDEETAGDAHTAMPINLVKRSASATVVNADKALPQVQPSGHILKAEQGANSSFLMPGVSRGITYLTTPAQPVNKILFKSCSKEGFAMPILSPKDPQAAPASVIRVVTNTGAGSRQEPLEVFNVLPTSQVQMPGPSMPVPRQYVLQTGGSLHQVPARSGATPHLSGGHSQIVEGVSGIPEHEHSKSGSYTVYTVAGNHAVPTASTQLQAVASPSNREGHSLLPVSKAPVTYTLTDGTTLAGANGAMAGQGITGLSHLSPSNCHTLWEQNKLEWQLSSDASSTDSELEEIFGDCFRFTRPKVLVSGSNASQAGTQ